jgi:hypothetical protein
MVAYDANVIVQFADRLYRQAQRMAVAYAVRGFVLGALVGFGVLAVSRIAGLATGELVLTSGFLGLLGAALGWSIGRERAFSLRLQAQQALCQVQIEANTRPSSATSRAA